jgi:primosomal protein N' (replication factor Y)
MKESPKFLVQVLTGIHHLSIATYYIDQIVSIGTIVNIPFGRKNINGVIYKYIDKSDIPNIKSINKIYDTVKLNENFVSYLNKFAYYNIISTSYLIKYIQNLLPQKPMKTSLEPYENYSNPLNDEQRAAYENILANPQRPNVLWGVTGSGKTEVFFHLIWNALQKGEQVLVLFPEISLSNNMVERFEKTFGIKPIVWNSQCKSKSKFYQIQTQTPLIVLGSRCSLLLPFKNLKTIILDEEHDRSYKQSNQYAYSARNMCILRSKIEGCLLVLSSATISIETYNKIQQNEFNCVRLLKRHSELSNPKITIQRLNDDLLSDYTISKCKEALSKNQQIFFYLNRKGYAFIVKCNKCNNRIACTNCETNLVLHKYPNEHLLCHKCGRKYDSRICLQCSQTNCLFSFGVGVDRLKEHIEKILETPAIVLSGDNVIEDLQYIHEYSIVIGTQVLAKGHNFPKLSLVIMVNVDNGGYDFRSNEINLQTLYQVAGRAGRGKMDSSEVIIQTYKPTQQLEYLKSMNYEAFLKHELEIRKQWYLPPFMRLIAIRFTKKVDYKLIDLFKASRCFVRVSNPLLYNNRISVILFIEINKFHQSIEFIMKYCNMNDVLIDVDPQEII